jgi:hypothetical protein
VSAWQESRQTGPFPQVNRDKDKTSKLQVKNGTLTISQFKKRFDNLPDGSPFARKVVPYPYDDGASLGQGWDYVNNVRLLSSCIDFKATQDLYQDATYQLDESIDLDSLDVSLNIALGAEAHGSFLGIKAGAETKSSFDSKYHTQSSDKVLVAHASVVNGATYVTPVDPGSSHQGNVSTPPKNDDIRPGKGIPNGVYSDNTLRLAPTMAKLNKTDPERFRDTCGDGFIASIVSGADLYVMYHFRELDRALSLKLEFSAKANAGFGSLFGASGSSDFTTAISTASMNSQLGIHLLQSGGQIA